MKKYLGKIAGVLLILLAMGMTVCAAETDDINIKKNQVFQVNSDADLHEQPDAASAVTATLPGGTPVIVREDAADGWCLVSYQKQSGYVQVSILGFLGSPISSAAPASTDQEQQGAAENQTVPPGEADTDGAAVPAREAGTDGEADTDGAAAQPGEADAGSTVSDSGTAGSGETQTPDRDLLNDGAEIKPESVQGKADGDALVQDVSSLDEEFRNVQEENIFSYQEAEAAKKRAASGRIWKIVIAVLVIAIFAVGIGTTLAGNKGKKRQE